MKFSVTFEVTPSHKVCKCKEHENEAILNVISPQEDDERPPREIAVICRNCGRAVFKDEIYCTHCGNPLGG